MCKVWIICVQSWVTGTVHPAMHAHMKNQTPSTELTGVEAAVRSLDRKGTVADLARRLGISRVAVLAWGNTIPLARLTQVERKTGVPREVLRPGWLDEIIKTMGVPPDMLRVSLTRQYEQRLKNGKAKPKAKTKTKATPTAE